MQAPTLEDKYAKHLSEEDREGERLSQGSCYVCTTISVSISVYNNTANYPRIYLIPLQISRN